MRVYLPSTLPRLGQWLAAGAAPPGPAYAVTPGLREWYREGDQEELEYAAQVAAARGSLALLAAEPLTVRRRVVLAADVPDADVAVRDDPRGSVAVGAVVPLAWWASALVDDEDADAVVSIAASALDRVAAGDADAQFDVDAAEALDLGWYAVQELPSVIG